MLETAATGLEGDPAMAKEDSLSRRKFLKGAAGATGVALAFPAIVPARVLGADAPSNKIQMAGIGLGGMGTGDLNGFLGDSRVRVVGVCDVDQRHRDRAKSIVDGRYKSTDCKAYFDFRDLIGRGDLDAVWTALPDHWHAIPAIAAAKAGCDIHGQKPFARTIREGRAMCDAVHRYGRIWQTGSQQRSDGRFRFACELVRNGRIGKVQRVEVGLPTAPTIEPQPRMPVPGGLDYQRWLGPAPWAPYTEKRCHWNFRWILDYSGGQVTDTGAHDIDIAHWGMGLDHTGPIEVEGSGEFPSDGLWDVATDFRFRCLYARGASPMHPGQVEILVGSKKHLPGGTKFIGTDGWIRATRGGTKASSASLLREKIGPGEIRLDAGRGEHRQGHRQNFLDSVRTRTQPVTPIEIGQRSITPAHLGNIAMILGRKVRFNPQTERFVNDSQADRMLSRGMRSPWTMEG
jgi:predicted dehydrogenase